MEIVIESDADVVRQLALVSASAERTQRWIKDHEGDPLSLLRSLKFETVGWHPIGEHALNVVEQINQTFTYLVALHAARQLLALHPDVGGFVLAPGATMSRALDIMSRAEGIVGAETFAAVLPTNNGKLAKDLQKMEARTERHRYVFFASPRFPDTQRLPTLERGGVNVWSLAI